MKKLQKISFLIFIMIFLPGIAFGQDLIYRSNSLVLNIEIISCDGKTVKYRLPGDDSGRIFYLSSSELDSLRYSDGKSMIFQKNHLPVKTIKRNYIGTDIFNTCFKNPNLSFERLSSSGNTSMSVELLINLNAEDFYGVYSYWKFTDNLFMNYDPYYFFTKVSLTTYPFNYSLEYGNAARIYMGGSLLTGIYKADDYDNETYPYEFYKKAFALSLVWSMGVKLHLSEGLQLKCGVDISMLPFLVFCSPEIGFAVGF